MTSLIEYLEKNKEWIFSGLGVAIISSGLGLALSVCVILLRKWFQNRKRLVSIFQDGTIIKLHNGCKVAIDVHFVSFTLKDIFAPKGLTRPPTQPIYCKPERPVEAGQNAELAELGKVFHRVIEEYTADDRQAFEKQFPGLVSPFLVGVDITVDYSTLGSPYVKRTKIERILVGNEYQGFVISKKPYGRDSTMPTRIRLKEKLYKILEGLRDPLGWYNHRKQMRLVQAQLTMEAILRALHYRIITHEDAQHRLNKIRDSLDNRQRELFDEKYLSENVQAPVEK